jgi:hypothetical protein
MKILRVLLQLKRNSIESEIDTFKEYLYDINNLAIKEKQRLDNMVEEMVRKNPDEAEDIYDNYSDQYAIYETKYLEYAFNGSLVNSYSYFEHQLKDIVRSLKKLVTSPRQSFRRNGSLSYAENLRDEIISISGLNFSSLAAKWVVLDKYRRVRNVIVHNGANLIEDESIPLTNQRDYSLISSFSQIKINSDGDFYITDREFVIKYFELIDEYLKKVVDILQLLSDNDIR